MGVVQAILKVANYAFTAVALLSGLAALWFWYEAIKWWGSPGAMATALTWTVVTVVLFACVIGIEYLQNKGE